MLPIIFLIDKILEIYVWILIGSIVFSWLLQFGVLQGHNPTVRMIGEFLYRITDPVLRPIRNFLPYLGPIDISPMIVILLIWFIRMELVQLAGYL
jgi:YggT family protein